MLDAAEALETYKDYVALLHQEMDGLLPLAYTHGYRCPDDRVSRGQDLRDKIRSLIGN